MRAYGETAVSRAINSTQAQVHPVIPTTPPTMRTSLMIIFVAAVTALALSEARYYKKINNDYVAYVDWSRGKRQSHPDTTVARIPQIPFTDSGPNDAAPPSASDGEDVVPAPAEYLTPPAAPDALLSQASQLTPQQPPPPSDKWNLGFSANDILVPPLTNDQAGQYDTLKLFTLLPTSNQPQGDLIDGFGPEEQESAADSRTPFVQNGQSDSYKPEFRPSRQEESPSQSSSNSPVYTFVKTDPHGHFKWGVHIGH